MFNRMHDISTKCRIIMIAVVIVLLSGCSPNRQVADNVAQQSIANTADAQIDNTDIALLEKYDAIITEAKLLNADQKYIESNKKLAEMPVSDLAKDNFSAIKKAAEEITIKNDEAISALQVAETNQSLSVQNQPSPNIIINNNPSAHTPSTPSPSQQTVNTNQPLGKWAGTYSFYYRYPGQIQSTLSIDGNGNVVQNNTDGTAFYGTAQLFPESGRSILSYHTND